MNEVKLDKYKRDIAKVYDRRKETYDKGKAGNWHYDLACRLVELIDLRASALRHMRRTESPLCDPLKRYAKRYPLGLARVRSGQKVLDLATGTGMVAIEATKKVGSTGQVIGVDISSGLLSAAQSKIDAEQLNNITLELADIEVLDFAENSFDCILCCSAFPLLTDVPADLRLWHSFLVPEGKIGLCVFAETAFVHGVVLQKVARRYEIDIAMSDLTGTLDRCRSLLSTAGYKAINITTEQYGSYIALDSSADKSWEISLQHPHCYPLLDLPSSDLEKAKSEYIEELEVLVTDKGIWNDITTYFVIARK